MNRAKRILAIKMAAQGFLESFEAGRDDPKLSSQTQTKLRTLVANCALFLRENPDEMKQINQAIREAKRARN
jgi:hypothetical protein